MTSVANSFILVGDCREALRELADESVHCCVTSPPYWGLRDYGMPGQLGLEAMPEEYVAKLVAVFREVKRVLRKDGTLWLNLGDSYARTGGTDRKVSPTAQTGNTRDSMTARGDRTQVTPDGLKTKDLVGIPWLVAFALRADGWYLRSDIIWAKPNPMPESVTDRPTRAHEYIFLLTKSAKYYYDADAVKEASKYGRPNAPDKIKSPHGQGFTRRADKQRGHGRRHAGFNDRWDSMTREEQCSLGRNKRSVWTVATKPFKGAHFATFPPDLIEPCILTGSPVGGIVLDPFFGAGTTGLVAQKHGRAWIGCELNEEYAQMAFDRISKEVAK